MPLRLTNTLTGHKEEFQPLHPPTVTLYVCGVTVYDHCHIGHARGAVVFDVLRRYLESGRQPFKVTYVRNITDVDDKIIERARAEAGRTGTELKTACREVAKKYEVSFREDFGRLGLVPPTHEPRATEFIPKMIGFIADLLKKEAAYEAPDAVYFSIRRFSEKHPYGQLSHQKLDEMREGVLVKPGEGKKDPLDFALWKKAKTGEPSWDSPWGPGRPGWHIECSTMSTTLLGDAFDIHGGGQDLIFPHHENELVQAEGAGKKFAKVWLHNGLLTVNNQKMSKSVGNIIRIQDALERHPPDVLRLFYLSAHYRSPIDFTWEHLGEIAHAYDRLATFLARADALDAGDGGAVLSDKVKEADRVFHEAMEDDLNTPRALAALFELVGHANDTRWLDNALMRSTVRVAKEKIRELGGLLGFFQVPDHVGAEAEQLVRERDEARRKKDFKKADQIRLRLIEQGYVVEDTSGKTVVRKRV
ncbi:MAG: cysteine--tRNA ligase [Candidatus Omnitrophica bacterium]|nr:cysteine--tRNA ligase [Candidatus Omnitrophota bacterium]